MISHQARCETFLLLRLQNLRLPLRLLVKSQVKSSTQAHIHINTCKISFVAVHACRFGSAVQAVCVRLHPVI